MNRIFSINGENCFLWHFSGFRCLARITDLVRDGPCLIRDSSEFRIRLDSGFRRNDA